MSSGIQKFVVLLDSPNTTFSPGQVIAGRVIVDLKRPKSIRGLRVTVKGKAEVKWSGTTGTGKDKKTVYYTGDEEYFKMEFNVLGRADGENVVIQTGSHVYPFNFCLPRNIPSSFESQHGFVRYTVRAVMDRPWKFDHEATIAFNVETPYDICQSSAVTAIDDEEHETFCCFSCFNMGAMKVNIFLPSSGFAIGEAIQAKININNSSTSVDVTKVKLQLQQTIKLFSRFPQSTTKTQTNLIQKVKRNGPFSKQDELVISMQVPSLPYSNMTHCTLIDVEYHLHVIIGVSGCHCDTKKKYPIVIGTKPALNIQPAQIANMIPASVPTAPFLPAESPVDVGTLPVPYSSPHGGQYSGNTGNEYNAPAPGFLSPIPAYGFVPGNQPYPSTMPVALGFDITSLTQPSSSTGPTEKPPPSYNEAMGIGRAN